MTITISEAIQRTVEHREIFPDEMTQIWMELMTGKLTQAQIAGLTIGLRVKKETIGEITAAAKVMRQLSKKVVVKNPETLLDIVGTGGDGAKTFNISTTSMFVIAAAGGRVAKHGGGSVSSKSGAADALKAIGGNIMLNPEQIAQCIEETGTGFMFAPLHHAAMKYAAPVRKELGVRTIFNILGPLTNPANAGCEMLGVFHQDLVGICVRVLKDLGLRRALVVYGCDGMDEVSLGAKTMIGELIDGKIREYDIHPEDFNLPMSSVRHLQVNSPEESVKMMLDVLHGENTPAKTVVIFNSGVGLYTAGLVPSIAAGIQKAREAVDSGAALEKMRAYVAKTNELAGTEPPVRY
ncbi:anthranilate phosphoribosyltransferase [Mesosutterella sp. OilRF-GAM-744-9]|uniref:Anthranilate phosphoribosyltransferase n=1 Tax=Mesosutterella porci TaxID=2915351 RepID=A0ABS9MRQ8_9BURK|nr:anthranilate phosphoribosyltransferase [Mesosutterella sp. oilRF-744-WT-GAM-9]MCG5031057.1 anthranilate phosphoribosyltransferase [Mesosutterella sp. oilRF-744-WT-GAM-9]MCI6530806.1 anthranilate phosphoribosyltransferase [Mesosutterella sp.]